MNQLLTPDNIREQPYVVIQIMRESVDRCEPDFAVRKLAALTSTPDLVDAVVGKLVLLFDGWDDDPRELLEIPEVRRFYASLLALAPHLPLFLHDEPQLNQHSLLVCSNLPISIEHHDEGFYAGFEDPEAAAAFCNGLIASGKAYLQQQGLDPERLSRPLANALAMLFPSPSEAAH